MRHSAMTGANMQHAASSQDRPVLLRIRSNSGKAALHADGLAAALPQSTVPSKTQRSCQPESGPAKASRTLVPSTSHGTGLLLPYSKNSKLKAVSSNLFRALLVRFRNSQSFHPADGVLKEGFKDFPAICTHGTLLGFFALMSCGACKFISSPSKSAL